MHCVDLLVSREALMRLFLVTLSQLTSQAENDNVASQVKALGYRFE